MRDAAPVNVTLRMMRDDFGSNSTKAPFIVANGLLSFHVEAEPALKWVKSSLPTLLLPSGPPELFGSFNAQFVYRPEIPVAPVEIGPHASSPRRRNVFSWKSSAIPSQADDEPATVRITVISSALVGVARKP
ncbi:unannotated protein [freshwater metagenome]|uniref:Unannotated protein n=1 Tax=freshwater metagenome TaxID=449393 RepID=A0A6J6MMV4_9ZZZZ